MQFLKIINSRVHITWLFHSPWLVRKQPAKYCTPRAEQIIPWHLTGNEVFLKSNNVPIYFMHDILAMQIFLIFIKLTISALFWIYIALQMHSSLQARPFPSIQGLMQETLWHYLLGSNLAHRGKSPCPAFCTAVANCPSWPIGAIRLWVLKPGLFWANQYYSPPRLSER